MQTDTCSKYAERGDLTPLLLSINGVQTDTCNEATQIVPSGSSRLTINGVQTDTCNKLWTGHYPGLTLDEVERRYKAMVDLERGR